MQIRWRRSVPRSTGTACALGMLVLGGMAACEQVASPELRHAANVAEGTGGIAGSVRNLEGQPVPGATIRVPGAAETVTDPAGQFRLAGLPASPRVAVQVDAPGYDGTVAIFEVRAGAELSRPITIQPIAQPVVIDAAAGGSVPVAGGGEVVIPANAFAGVIPGTSVNVQATYIDTQDPAQFSTAPGDFTGRTFGGGDVQLESFGMISIVATDPQGQPLDLAPGTQATLRLPLRGGTTVPTRALWTFDPQQGIWVEEGIATVTPTGIEAEVSTLAPRRNVDTPFREVCISVRVLRADKVTPRPNEYVSATGVSYAGFTQGWTNATGVVQLTVRASSQVQLQAGPQQAIVTTPPAGTPGCPGVATFAF